MREHTISEYNKYVKLHNTWKSINERCSNKKYQDKHPTYKSCSISPEWKEINNFIIWFVKNYDSTYMQDWQLDKDILIKGNKIYSPETCCFVPQEINKLVLKSEKTRGKCPIGVKFEEKTKKYISRISINGSKKHIGCYDTPEEAFEAYKIAKESYIKEVANKYKSQITEACYQALINYKIEIND